MLFTLRLPNLNTSLGQRDFLSRINCLQAQESLHKPSLTVVVFQTCKNDRCCDNGSWWEHQPSSHRGGAPSSKDAYGTPSTCGLVFGIQETHITGHGDAHPF
ncbi:hypothetical protein CYMTET_16338 [Cymbomonas tetramitiformis]|uniref:Uncharacterized protein n=1 Tax=Cymbomonas tetramitiformis TaxID=36881 RepID=A0AAE0GCB7_9CHLO|nr:hypothetical protein CYMTET_16338 [Cymbomonas tetramitiformis]